MRILVNVSALLVGLLLGAAVTFANAGMEPFKPCDCSKHPVKTKAP